jgi:hypothetical protein
VTIFRHRHFVTAAFVTIPHFPALQAKRFLFNTNETTARHAASLALDMP